MRTLKSSNWLCIVIGLLGVLTLSACVVPPQAQPEKTPTAESSPTAIPATAKFTPEGMSSPARKTNPATTLGFQIRGWT